LRKILRNVRNFELSSGSLSNAADGVDMVVSVDFVDAAVDGAGETPLEPGPADEEAIAVGDWKDLGKPVVEQLSSSCLDHGH
jgi:hypothetical protein